MAGKHNISATESFKGKPLTVNADGRDDQFLPQSPDNPVLSSSAIPSVNPPAGRTA